MTNLRFLTASLVVGLSATAALAQSAPVVVAQYDRDPALASAVSDAVVSNADAAFEFCQAATGRDQTTQVYVGAGLAAAYSEFVGVNDRANAAAVANVACGCGENVAVSFSNSVGVPLGDVCSTSWSGDYAGVKPYLWRLLATGGGNGVSRN